MKFNQVLSRVINLPLPPLRVGEVELRLLDCHFSLRPPETPVIEHEHPHYELALMRQGSMETFCDGNRILCTPANGTFQFIPPATLHRRIFGPDRDNINLNFNFLCEGPRAGELSSRLGILAAKCGYRCPPEPGLTALLREIRRQGEIGDAAAIAMLNHLLPAFLILFVQRNFPEIFEPGTGGDELFEMQAGENRIRTIKRLMVAMIGNPNPARAISERVKLSPRHLNRLFREKTGMTIKGYQNELRLDRARDLLSHSKLPVSMIAETLGFHQPKQFSTFFGRFGGCAPSEFRARETPDFSGRSGDD